MREVLIAGLWLAGCTGAAANPITGTWQNEAGSAVTFEVGGDGVLHGYYQTELGAPDSDSRFPLTGWVQGDVVAFSVSFTGFGSITSWSGQLTEDEDGPYLRTLWHYTKDIPDEAEDEDIWKTINSGYAEFRPTDDKTAPPNNPE